MVKGSSAFISHISFLDLAQYREQKALNFTIACGWSDTLKGMSLVLLLCILHLGKTHLTYNSGP